MLKELVLKNRSYRSFDRSRKITREELLDFVDLARKTPSTRNRQTLRYRLVHTQTECEKVLPLTGWAGNLKMKLPPKGHEPTAYIIICHDTAEPHEKFLRDVGITAQTIMLAATEAGLGGCMIGSFSGDRLSAALAISEEYRPMLVLALGKPDKDEIIELIEAEEGEIGYYREGGVHYVPKRPLDDIII